MLYKFKFICNISQKLNSKKHFLKKLTFTLYLRLTIPIKVQQIKMTTFNQFKNNTQILKKYLQKMNLITQSQIRPHWIQQSFLKQNNPHIFLQLLHYVLINFSPFVIFVKVLDYYPTIKDDNDKKFVTNVMALARKMFDVDVKIDIQQFLSQKFVQKKTEWIAQFAKSVYEMHLKQNKSGSDNKLSSNNNVVKKSIQSTSLRQVSRKQMSYQVNDEDSQDENPRNLNVAPSYTRNPIAERTLVKKIGGDSSSDQDMKQLLAKKSQLNKIKEKSNKNEIRSVNRLEQNVGMNRRSQRQQIWGMRVGKLGQRVRNQDEQEQVEVRQIAKNIKSTSIGEGLNRPAVKPKSITQQYVPQQEQMKILKKQQPNFIQQEKEHEEYVTRTELMQIMGEVSKNFSQILTKFNELQLQVGGWVQNVNAKISIIEENVKTIKNNL